MLHSESACIKTIEIVTDNDFSDPFTRDLFMLTQSLFTQNIKPTTVELLKEGQKLGFIKSSEDIEKIRHIAGYYIDEQNIGYWIGKLKDASKGRRFQTLLKVYAHKINREDTDMSEIIREASGDMFSLAMDAETEKTLTGKDLAEFGRQKIKSRVNDYRIAQQNAKFPGEAPLEGVPTGFTTLNKMSLGYKPGDLIVLGAQTGHGKTAFALITALAVCVQAKEPLYYLNTEMSKEQLVYRWGSILSGEPMQQIRTGSLSDGQLRLVLDGFSPLAESKFYTDDKPLTKLTPQRAEIKIRKHHMQFGIKIAIIDYVGRMQKFQKGYEEWQVLEQIVKSQKELAQDLGIAILILAQLNPDGSLQGAKRIKNECDIMFTLDPAESDDEGSSKKSKKPKKPVNGTPTRTDVNYYLHVEKARDFESGRDIPLFFNKSKQTITEVGQEKTGWEDVTDPTKTNLMWPE